MRSGSMRSTPHKRNAPAPRQQIANKPARASQPTSMSPSCACTHSRMISNNVTEEEQRAGKVRCIECGDVVPNPHLQQNT